MTTNSGEELRGKPKWKNCPFCRGSEIDMGISCGGGVHFCRTCYAQAPSNFWQLRPIEDQLADQVRVAREGYDKLKRLHEKGSLTYNHCEVVLKRMDAIQAGKK